MLSSSLEKYLLTIYTMSENSEEIKSSEVARTLNIPLKKTIQALQRMHYQKYIIYTPYQPLVLTEKGKEMARFIMERDNLMEEFRLILQLPEYGVDEREMIRQYISNDMLDAIEHFVVFVRQYPEISNRFQMFSKRKLKSRLIDRIPKD